MSARIGRSVRQRKLAAELRRLRELALLTGDSVAQELGWSPSKISRIENARIRLKKNDVKRLLRLYEVAEDQWDELLSLVEEKDHKGWWEAYADVLPPELLTLISFEAEAATALHYESMMIPGLLQTRAYATRVIGMFHDVMNAPPHELEERVEARMTRQQVLTSDNPLELSAIIDEGVLLRQIGPPAVMREQLRHLADMSDRPNIDVRILPLKGPHVVSPEPFVLLQVPDFGEVVSVDTFFGLRLYIQDGAQTYYHQLIFNALNEASLSAERSQELICAAVEQAWDE